MTNNTPSSKGQLLVKDVEIMGMPLKVYKWKSCQAEVGEEKNWATVYSIASQEQGKEHATELLKLLKYIYRDKTFGGTVALNPTMKHLYEKLGIKEYV